MSTADDRGLSCSAKAQYSFARTVTLIVLGSTVAAACSRAPTSPPALPTPDVPATVQAQVGATMSAVAVPTSPPIPPTPSPAAPTLEPTSTPELRPTARSVEDAVAAIKSYTVLVWNNDGSGSGISVGDGKVLPANHVVQGRGSVNVRFADGRQEPVRILQADSRRDVALLQSSFHDTPTARLRDARSLRALENLIAVGFPRADVIGVQDSTVTRGSYSGRWQSPQGVWHVQTDTPVNPGNSGGPLADADGQVIGLVRMQVRQSEGLNFAVASDEITAFLAGEGSASAAAEQSAVTIKPDLTDTSAAPRVLVPGRALTLTYIISYVGQPANIVLGASIRPTSGGAWMSDPSGDITVTLRPGQNTYSRGFSLPPELAPGGYDIAWGLLGTDMQTNYGLQVETGGLRVTARRVGSWDLERSEYDFKKKSVRGS
jgi:putative serine protease PepD